MLLARGLVKKADEKSRVGTGLEDSKCIPYVSTYTDCSDANACSGCTRCSCNELGRWDCQDVVECPQEDGTDLVDDVVLDNAIEVLYEGIGKKKNQGPGSLVPGPRDSLEDLLLVPDKRAEIEEELRVLMGRQKRSIDEKDHNDTVKFYETVDEMNEDTLRDVNATGTIEAQRVNAREIGKISRRVDVLDNNKAFASDLHIEYTKPHKLEHHIAENKVDSKHPAEDKINGLTHEEIHKILGNYSQIMKNKDLSKLVVNELTRGSERIGDKNVVPVSNITFTPENDTLTAMTFIAGNLLNKLWDMEKDANEGSYETELMKHEKINDLLELFKEPLSLRQESFLKNALQKLSRVIDTNKDINNMSLCATIEDPEIIKPNTNNCTEKSEMTKTQGLSDDIKIQDAELENKSKATANAINKINDVLNLMKKYETLQKKVNNLRSEPVSNIKISTGDTEKNMSIDENISLNLFGNLLDKITKLLSPNKSGKSTTKRIQTFNMLRKDEIAKRNLEKIFNINLANKTLSAKDKMIIDYLSSIEKHPNCVFTHLQKPAVTPLSNVEGSILYNLSESFKIKSFTDLLRTVNDKPDTIDHNIIPKATYTNNLKQNKTVVQMLRMNTKPKNGTLQSVKEKLKNDIKNILQDLFDLQKEHGIKTKSNINIADALPCIYNLLKSDDGISKDILKNNPDATSSDKIKSFMDSLKLDMKFVTPNRRSNSIVSPRPKSAIVWERVIKNLNKKYQKASRRNLGENPKSYKELRELIDKIESSSSTYKKNAIQSGVLPSDRLILLKTLEADNKRYINVLETIKKSLVTVTNLPSDKQNEFHEFIDNAAMNINLNNKLVALLKNFKVKRSENTKSKPRLLESKQPLLMIPKWVKANENNNLKLRRDQIMNQLIMNRLRLYIKTKERTEMDFNANANYNIARRILFHLENGNIALAKELYKVFLANKQQLSASDLNKFTEYHDKESFEHYGKLESRQPKFLTFQEPLVREEDAQKIKMLTQDYFLKQLWNLKE